MTLHRFFAEEPPAADAVEAPVPLSVADVRHLRDVLRLRPGDRIALAHEGRTAIVRLTAVDDVVRGVTENEVGTAGLPPVTLVQGLAKGEKMDLLVRACTELGAARILPVVAARSVVRLDERAAAARRDRWRRVAMEASKQSQRAAVPDVAPVVALSEVTDALAGSLVLVCWEDADGAPGIDESIRSAASSPERDVAVVVGPEGGFTAEEVALLVRRGALVVSLGPTVLRTETAGIVAVALAIHARGGLGAARP